jgi:hypothetical protein
MSGSQAGTIGVVWVPISRRGPIVGVGTGGIDCAQNRKHAAIVEAPKALAHRSWRQQADSKDGSEKQDVGNHGTPTHTNTF